jgi:hypothetical protein
MRWWSLDTVDEDDTIIILWIIAGLMAWVDAIAYIITYCL